MDQMIETNNLPGLFHFKRVNFEEFARDPTLEPQDDGETVEDGEIEEDRHTNWRMLSSVCYLYLPDMRKCIAQNAQAIQLEVGVLKCLCLSAGLPIDPATYDPEDFDFEGALTMVRSIYCEKTHLKVKADMKLQTPMLYNLMKPASSDRALESHHLPKYDHKTYESRGCPQVRRT